METIGRVCVSLAIFLAGCGLQQLGYWLIRLPHEAFDPAEFGGAIAIGLSWVAFWLIQPVWSYRRSA